MKECTSAISKLFEYLDQELDIKDTETFERHIELCRNCFDRFDFEKALRERVKNSNTGAEPSEACKVRIQNILKKFDS
ncbi:MAG: anti-sigma factor [Elusimicrobia bacterium]|nr:MAG: anti-sigma factor [Elusimicrobiota bacterium]